MAKIAVDARFYGLENTGLGRYTTNVLNYLPTYCKRDTLYVLLRQKYFDTLELPTNCIKVLADIPHYSVGEQVKFPYLIDHLGVDLLYTFHFNVPLSMRTPFVVTVHDLIKSHFEGSDTTTRTPLIYSLKRWGYKKVMHHAVTASRAVITPTNTVKNDILAAYNCDPGSIFPIAEAPDDIFRHHPQESTFNLPLDNYFLFVGNAYPHKNIATVLRALEIARDAELVMVAKTTPYLDKLLRDVPENVKRRITLLDSVPDDALVGLYTHARALITPSLMEGYGLPGLEALMVGTPVIASNIPAFREVYGDRVAYFDPQSPSELEKAMVNVKKAKTTFKFPRTWDDVAKDCAEVLHASCSRL